MCVDLRPALIALALVGCGARDQRPLPGPPVATRFDPQVRPAQATGPPPVEPAPRPEPLEEIEPLPPLAPTPSPFAAAPVPTSAGRPLGLEAALYGALAGNPDLVALRQNAPATAEAVEVARRFPVTLNPTIWADVRPWAFVPRPRGGNERLDMFVNVSIRQPIELGHQTTHRAAIAEAAHRQALWTIVQAEVLALVQTYRTYQTAAYRREKLRLAQDVSGFNEGLVDRLKKGREESVVAPADVALAEVERQSFLQLVEVARQDYAIALADLANQVGSPGLAGTIEPFGEFVVPGFVPAAQLDQLIAGALRDRPEVHAAIAQAEGAAAAVRLAKGDQVPTIVAGPEYQRGEAGVSFYGFIIVAPLPIVNNGAPLVRQRTAEHHRAVQTLRQIELRTIAQVRAAVAKWDASRATLDRTARLRPGLDQRVQELETLFQANSAQLVQLLQARQRAVQWEGARLDAIWQATQAQADLLGALGAPALLRAAAAR